jgi:hypothetical protein
VAVIVLAAVLIWVLQRGPVGPAAELGRPVYLAQLLATAYLAEAQIVDGSSTACRWHRE